MGAALASKAAVVAFATALAVGGQLTVQSVISPDTRAGGAAAMSQSLPTGTGTATADTRGARVDGARSADRPGAVREHPIAEDRRAWQDQAGPQYQAPSAEETTARNRETSPEPARAAGPAQPQNGAGGSSAQNLESGSAQTPAGNQYAGTSVSPAGGQSAVASRESAPANPDATGGDVSGDPSSTPSGDAGNALGGDPSGTPSGDAGSALAGEPSSAPSGTPSGDAGSALGGDPSKALDGDQPNAGPPRSGTGR